MWLGSQHHTSAALSHGKRRGTLGSVGRVGPTAGLNRCGGEKISCPPPVFEPRTVQPVASRYTGQRTKPQRTIKITNLGNPRNFFPFVPLGGLRCDYTDGGTSDTRGGRCFDVWKLGMQQGTRRLLYDGFAICQHTVVAALAELRQATHWQPDHHTALL